MKTLSYVYRIIRRVLRSVTWIACFYFTFRSIEVVAGQQTEATIRLAVSFVKTLPYIPHVAIGLVGSGGLVYGLLQRVVRQRQVRRRDQRIEDLERRLRDSYEKE